MAKKKAVSSEPLSVKQPTTPPTQEVTTKGDELPYTIGSWAGKPQYQCKHCEFDSLNFDVMLEHLIVVHVVVPIKEPTPPPAPPQIQQSNLERGESREAAD